MSRFTDLDEYAEEALLAALADRMELRAKGLCDYCRQPFDTPPCKFPERHSVTRAVGEALASIEATLAGMRQDYAREMGIHARIVSAIKELKKQGRT